MLTLIAVILGLLIIFIETVRPKNHQFMDFFRFISLVYFIVYVICPIFISYSIFGINAQAGLGWFRSSKTSLLYAETFALMGYPLLFFGYSGASSIVTTMITGSNGGNASIKLETKSHFSKRRLFVVGSLLGLAGGISLVFYASQIGGLFSLIKYAGALRSGEPPIITQYSFLKNVSPLVLSASFIFYGLWKDYKEDRRVWLYRFLFFLTLLMSMTIMFHIAGRLRLFSYLMTFPMVNMAINGRFKVRSLVFGLVFAVLLILFGKQVFHLFVDPETLSRKMNLLRSENYSGLTAIIGEFSFPLAVIANTVCYAVPNQIPYRYFVDFPLAIIYLVPKRFFNIKDLPVTANSLNGLQFGGGIPIDLISLGYYSLGVLGVVILLLLFGATLRLMDRIFMNQNEFIVETFRVSWMFFLGFRIMYGDPVNSLKAGFYLVIGTVLLLYCRRRGSQCQTCIPAE